MRKGVILVIVLGIALIIIGLALAGIFIMTQQARISEHKIKRMRAFFAAQAGMVHALEELRLGRNPNDTSITIGTDSSATSGLIPGYPLLGLSADIEYLDDNTGPRGTDPVNITVDY